MINKKIYLIYYAELKEQLLPNLLRKPKTLAFIGALIEPIKSLYKDFSLFRKKAIYRTDHYCSITLLQKVLNDDFDDVERRIYINNAGLLDTQHYYDEGLGDPLCFYDEGSGDPQWFFDQASFNVYGSDFTVFLPEELRLLEESDQERFETSIRAKLDYYKIYGTKYTLVWLS
jgi:hypothetical protein